MRLALLLLLALPAAGQVLTTEVWLGKLDMREGRFAVSDLKNISNHPGYDNQPAFFPDGKSLLYSSEAESLAETGLGVHAVRYWISNGKSEPLTQARGFSPTPTADGKEITTLREGTVWLHDLTGKPLRSLLPDVSTAGYYTRFDDSRWVLFLNEEDRQIAIWRKGSGLQKILPNAVTAPYRIPGTDAVSFVTQGPDGIKLMRMDVVERGGSIRMLAEIPFPTAGAHVWTSRGTVLMASGNAIHEWNPKKPEEWALLHRFTEADLQGITRIALSPSEDRIALVSVPNDMTVLRESRAAANRTIKDGEAASVRTPSKFEISGDKATEHGTAVRTVDGKEVRSEYKVIWKRTVSANGTPAWAIESEEFTVR